MQWNLAIQSGVANPANNLVAAIYDASAPTVVVQSQVLPGPYGGTIDISFLGVNPIVYNFTLWESATTSPTGTVRANFSLQPTQETTQVRASLYLVADVSTGFTSGTSTYTDASLSGWSYDLERRPQGTLQPTVDYSTSATSFSLLASGDVFNPGEQFILHFYPIVATTSAAVVTSNLFASYTTLSANTTLDNTYASKAIFLQGASSAFTITLPTLSTVTLFQAFSFYSDGGSHQNVSMVCQGSDVIQFGGTTVTSIILGQGERLILYKSGILSGSSNVWSVYEVSDAVKLVGELVSAYKMTELNCVFANGQLLSRSTYTRLWTWVQTLPPSQLVSDSTWNQSSVVDSQTYYLNQGLYSQGDGSSTFRVPLLSTNSFLRAVNGSSRVAGSGAVETIRAHTHTMHASGTIPSLNLYLCRDLTTGNANRYSGGGGDHLGGQSTPDTTMRTGNDNGVNGTSPTETVPCNTGIYMLIRC